MQVDGKSVKLTEVYSTNISAITKEVQELIQTFDDAHSSPVKGIVTRIKGLFRRAQLVFNEDHIKDLIQSAKHIEISQHIILSAAILVQNKFK